MEKICEKYSNPQINILAIYPNVSIIPALQRFQMAPYKFKRGITFAEGNKYFVFFDDEAIFVLPEEIKQGCGIYYTPMAYVFTRTSKKIYGFPVPLDVFPASLSYYISDGLEYLQTYDNLLLVKDHFRLHLVPYGKPFKQGHLELVEICSVNEDKVYRWAREICEVKDAEYPIFNHKVKNASVYKLDETDYLIYSIKPTKIISDEHGEVELKDNTWYLVYHPLPSQAD